MFDRRGTFGESPHFSQAVSDVRANRDGSFSISLVSIGFRVHKLSTFSFMRVKSSVSCRTPFSSKGLPNKRC